MHFMAQRVRAAGQAMQRKDDCSRPLAQGLCGGIPHDVQDFLDLVNEGKVDLRGSISHTWNFEDAQAAFDFVDSRDPSYRKGVLTFKK